MPLTCQNIETPTLIKMKDDGGGVTIMSVKDGVEYPLLKITDEGYQLHVLNSKDKNNTGVSMGYASPQTVLIRFVGRVD